MKHLTYKDWSFLFFIFVIIINIVVAVWIVNHIARADLEYEKAFSIRLLILSIASRLFFIAGSIQTIMSVIKKKSKNYKYYFSVIEYPVFFIGSLIMILFQ